MANDAGFVVRVVDTAEGLTDIASGWATLAATAPQPNVFATPEWSIAAWRHRVSGAGGQLALRVLVVERVGRMVALVPLVMRTIRRAGLAVRKLEFIDSELADYSELLCGPDADGALVALAEHLVSTRAAWDLVDLRNVPSTAHWLDGFARAVEQVGLRQRMSVWERCPFLPITSTWDGFLATRSRSTRGTYRNQASRIGREGLTIRVTTTPHEEPELVTRLAALDAERGGGVQQGPVREHPNFFREMIETLGPKGWLFLAIAEQHGKLLAYKLGYRCGRKIWDHTGAYSREQARLSLGTMLLPAIFDFGFAHGFDEYDFLRGEEEYKLRLADQSRPTHRLELWSGTLRSRATAALAAWRKRHHQPSGASSPAPE